MKLVLEVCRLMAERRHKRKGDQIDLRILECHDFAALASRANAVQANKLPDDLKPGHLLVPTLTGNGCLEATGMYIEE